MIDNAAQKSPIANSIIARYRRSPDLTGDTSMDGPQMLDAMNSQGGPPVPPPQSVPQPTLGTPQIGQGYNAEDPTPQPGQSQWNQDPQAKQGSGLANVAGLLAMKEGAIVTSPTIAKIGEKGPEAVVPLTPRPGNKLQPDLLEGHITAPKVPGVRYSRYKSFNRFGRGGGA